MLTQKSQLQKSSNDTKSNGIKKRKREAVVPNSEKSLAPQHRGKLKQRSDALLNFRKSLPIWSSSKEIKDSLEKKDLLILVGETGSGKSTQVPQFLMGEPWCSGRIAITQPRRVAAISLARRVAEEVGTPLGSASPASTVGYSIRFDYSVSPNTKIKFLTEGMLLKEMLKNSSLEEYSAIIVDEVHERSINVDLILGFLHRILCDNHTRRNKQPLKVIIMSATADVEGLTRFFDQENHSNSDKDSNVSICHVPGRLFPVKVTHLQEPVTDFVLTAVKTIFQIHYKEPLPGDILVFLTGQEIVETTERLVTEYSDSMDTNLPKMLVLPLYAALSQESQQKVFYQAPFRTRKVILSTNIAETSVTVPGVRHVIDCGKMKVKQFRSKLGLDSLLVKKISKSSAIQRQGRAGREAAGHCYRLYTKQSFEEFQNDSTPEILRCDLTDAILGMKARGIQDLSVFPFISSPPKENMEKALLQLFLLGALNETGGISDIGTQMARLPLAPPFGRVIIEAAFYGSDCLVDVIDIIASLSVENVFQSLKTEQEREDAEEPRKRLLRRDGDHLTLLATVRSYAAEMTDRKAWSDQHFVSHRAMKNVMNIRKQLFQLCKQLKLLPSHIEIGTDETPGTEEKNEQILKCLIKGFPTNTARLCPDGSYKTFSGNQTVAIHPSSVLFGRKLDAIIFSEYVYTTKSFGRNVSTVRLKWVEDAIITT